MSEAFLQFIWEQRLFNNKGLVTTDGESVEVVAQGTRNSDSGPDFFNAKIRIDGTLWVGNVEIHRYASDWERHDHQGDGAYDNVILHVVQLNDKPVMRKTGGNIPTLEITYPEQLLENYQQLLAAKTWIACQPKFHTIDPFVLGIGFNRLMIERLQDKTSDITARLQTNKSDWNETFYQILARSFGFKTNALPFELLAKSLPLSVLRKHNDNLFQLEALLFGQSGLLNLELLGDDYFLELRNEYGFLMKKYKLTAIEGHLWKFLRLRPANFPTLRIAQMAKLLNKTEALLSQILETEKIDDIISLFSVKASEYWDNHYRFSYKSRKSEKRLGSTAINTLIINTVVPFLFVYGEQNNKPFLKDRALEWLDKLPPETNSIITKWESLGVQPRSAFETQALLQLKNRYCADKQCLKCHVGNKIIRL